MCGSIRFPRVLPVQAGPNCWQLLSSICRPAGQVSALLKSINSQRSIYTTVRGSGPHTHTIEGIMGPNALVVVYVDPLGLSDSLVFKRPPPGGQENGLVQGPPLRSVLHELKTKKNDSCYAKRYTVMPKT